VISFLPLYFFESIYITQAQCIYACTPGENMTYEGPRNYCTSPSALPTFERGKVASHIQYYLSAGGSKNGLGLGSFRYIRCGGRSHHVQRAIKKQSTTFHCFLPVSVSGGTACGIALALVALLWRLVEMTPQQYSRH